MGEVAVRRNIVVFALCALALQSACGGGAPAASGGPPAPPAPPAQPSVAVSVSPATASVHGADTQQFTATVTNSTNTAVTWSVNGIAGGDDTVGRINASGLYTAPLTPPAPNTLTVSATSAAAATATGNSAVTLLAPIPVVTSMSPTVVGTGNIVVTVSGSKFITNAQIVFGGAALATTLVSQNTVMASTTVTTAQAQAGTIAVYVRNVSPTVEVSNTTSIRSMAGNQVSAFAASRFLSQATFGPTFDQITQIQQIGFENFLQDQFQAPVSTYSDPGPLDDLSDPSTLQRQFFTNALFMPDQLRQRTSFALHKIWAVSWVVVDRWDAFAGYLRMHQNHAFTNYRTIMENVTKDPAMGAYQDIANNDKANPTTGVSCNENYGRELMQLFTIGIWQLNQDGTLKRDAQNNPIPTYDQTVVENNACALTGWTYRNAPGRNSNWPRPQYFGGPLEAVESHHDLNAKTLLNGFTLPAGQTTQQDLTGTLDNLFTYANMPPHVSRLFIQQFVTSNPSPAYIKRIADVFVAGSFTSNGVTFGSGQRGDMKALVAAVLLDPEARLADDPTRGTADEGKLREPVLFLTALLRVVGARSDGSRPISDATNMSQRLLYPPTVFSYFSPDNMISGSSLLGPEFQLHNTATAFPRANFLNSFAYGSLGSGTTVDLTPFANIAGNIPQLLDSLNLVLLNGRMSTQMRTSITTALNAIPAGTSQNLNRARAAIYLIGTSSQFSVQR